MINVCTLSWNGLSLLQELKDGLYQNLQELNEDFCWYIRDNGSKDGTVEEVSKWEKVKILAKDHNRDNFSQGMNSLIGMATENSPGDYFLFLNNDIKFKDGLALKQMIKLMKGDKEIGIVGARLMYPGGDILGHCGIIFSDRYNKLPWNYRSGEKLDENAKKSRYFQCITAALMLVRSECVKEVNGFDEDFFWAFDDCSFGLKVGQLGKKIAYCGETEVEHGVSVTLKKNPVNKLFMNQNVKTFKDKWQGKYEIDHDKYLQDPNYKLII